MEHTRKAILYGTTAFALALIWTGTVCAQGAEGEIEEIIVTARKQQESILKVPVVETVLTQSEIDRLQTTQMTDLPRLVPGLNIGHSLLSIGTLVSIRGVGTSSPDPGVDQSVSLNVDGLSLGNGLAFNSGMFDLQQIEVLKGPQALFYGKSSPGGVISLRTADPTDEFEGIVRGGYEFEAREKRGELIVSGPITDKLKGRIAGFYTAADGYFTNNEVAVVPSLGAKQPNDRAPRSNNYMVRGTLLWNPTDNLSARLKMNYVYDHVVDSQAFQLTGCPDGLNKMPLGIPFITGDDCTLNRNITGNYANPAFYPGMPGDGSSYVETTQKYGTLELNYAMTRDLQLTSTTAFYRANSNSLAVAPFPSEAGSPVVPGNDFYRHEFTEELRLTSEFTFPVNFTTGAFYQDGTVFDRVPLYGTRTYIPLFPYIRADAATTMSLKTSSLFGQVRWKIVPKLELAGGVRWTDEKRSEKVYDYIASAFRNALKPEVSSSNFAPEATLTYTPTDDLTFFGAYKQGFKSGSFSLATPANAGADNSFGDEKVRGYEVGMKSRLLDRRLAMNLAYYDYRYEGLQVGATQPPLANGISIIRTVNAGSARTYGVDLDLAYRPTLIKGLNLHGSVSWDHGRYGILNNVPCYSSQMVSEGCNQLLNPVSGRYSAQDLSGTPLVRAPDWQTTVGFDYEFPVDSNMKMVISNSNTYQTKMRALLAVDSGNGLDPYQHSFIKTDLSVALRSAADRWELAVIGKNLNDKVIGAFCTYGNFANGNIGGQITGGTTRGPAGQAESACYSDPGRAVWVRLTLKPFALRQ